MKWVIVNGPIEDDSYKFIGLEPWVGTEILGFHSNEGDDGMCSPKA